METAMFQGSCAVAFQLVSGTVSVLSVWHKMLLEFQAVHAVNHLGRQAVVWDDAFLGSYPHASQG